MQKSFFTFHEILNKIHLTIVILKLFKCKYPQRDSDSEQNLTILYSWKIIREYK